MNIAINDTEYKDLLDVLHIADVVLSGHRHAEDIRSMRHRALIQKLYSLAKDAGLGGMMVFDENARKHVPTPAFEESTLAHAALNEFGEHLFWDHLINRLSQRDAALVAGGVEGLSAMNENEVHRLHDAIRQRYAEEFARNDIGNLRLVAPFSPAEGVHVKTSD